MSWDQEAREVLVQSLDPYNVDYTRTHGERLDDVLDALAPVVAREVARAKLRGKVDGLRAVADDLASLTHGDGNKGIEHWPAGDQNIYELAIEEASAEIHDRADAIEAEAGGS